MSPEEIKKREFASQLRGYDKDEVRSFLRRISDEVNRLQEVEAEVARRTPAVLAAEAAAQRNAGSDASIKPVADSQSSNVASDLGIAAPQMPAAPERPAAYAGEPAADDLSVSSPVSMPVSASTDSLVDDLNPADDRFEALGDRIAALLRDAHMSAGAVREKADSEARGILEQARVEASALQTSAAEEAEALRVEAANDSAATRSAAEEEAEAIRAEARNMAETNQAEIDRQNLEFANIRSTNEAELAELREQSINAGHEEIADQRAEAEQELAEARADREQAMAELADAREQVAELLYQARTQSEFIRHEAEEIIRSKVRQNVEQAESRLAMLRNSEVASRERLSAAQRELNSAMARLEAEPQPSLPADADDVVLAEAVEKGEATGYGKLDALVGGSTASVETEYEDVQVDEAEYTEAEYVEPDDAEAEYVEAEYVEAGAAEADYVEAEYVEAEYVEAEYVQAEPDYVEAEYVEAVDLEAVDLEAEYVEADAETEPVGAEYQDADDAEPEDTEDELADTQYSDTQYSDTHYDEAEYSEADDVDDEAEHSEADDVDDEAAIEAVESDVPEVDDAQNEPVVERKPKKRIFGAKMFAPRDSAEAKSEEAAVAASDFATPALDQADDMVDTAAVNEMSEAGPSDEMLDALLDDQPASASADETVLVPPTPPAPPMPTPPMPTEPVDIEPANIDPVDSPAVASELPSRIVPPAPPAPPAGLAPDAPVSEFSAGNGLDASGDLEASSYESDLSTNDFGSVDEHRVDEHRVDEHRVDEHRVDEHRVDERVPVAAGIDEAEASPDEDALARLVREAMQRAVDSARSSD